MRFLLVWLTVLVAATAARAQQREPVLKQIREPHPYYFREMYLPQVTTGPNAVAWSPDGKRLVYAMQGSLWVQTLGTTVAEQLTSGAYDSEPDWSPDGRTIVFTRYAHDAIELMLVDVASGTTRALTSNGAVNVDPRWSPDGTRVAFVSTEYEGRWHVFVRAVAPGAPGEVRVTEDRDSKLPRYYYSVWDQYLSPTWSPDGTELIVISNRGAVWGSGSFWRMRADGTGTMRLIHEEETTWKARPDWSSDGRRVVYSSYAGRQRNQLWLMTSDGENPFQLTYGDWDATAPRWSPDTKRIAYISNETGNTSLWIVEVPGGARTRVEARTLRWREPVGALTVLVTDAVTGRLVDARVSVTGADSRAWAPRDALRRADDSFDRRERAYEVGYFHTSGRAELTVPEGEYTLEVTHGPEYRVERRTVRVSARAARTVRVAVRRLIDLPRLGWWSGDLHVHMNYGGAYKVEPSGLASQARAEDLHEVEDLIVNKEQRFPDIAYFRGASPDPVSTPRTLIVHSQEYHTSYWGHTALLGLEDHLVLPGYAAYQHTAAASLYPANANVFDMGHAQGALTGYVHPFDSAPDPADTTQSLTDELPVDVALGKTDYMEILGFSDHRATADVWYRLLNCGFRLPAGAGTDAMSNFASLRGPVGLNRVYVRTGATLDHTKWMDGIRAGRTFATNGPLLRLTVNGKEPGADIALPLGRHTLTVKVELYSNVPVDHLELVRNGNVVDSIPLSDDRMSAVATRTITVNKSAWVTLRAWSDHAEPPILDAYPFATTSPVYVTVAGLPVRSPDDARYFMAWVDRLREDALASTDWNTEEERRAVLDLIARARAEFEKRSYEQSVMAPR